MLTTIITITSEISPEAVQRLRMECRRFLSGFYSEDVFAERYPTGVLVDRGRADEAVTFLQSQGHQARKLTK